MESEGSAAWTMSFESKLTVSAHLRRAQWDVGGMRRLLKPPRDAVHRASSLFFFAQKQVMQPLLYR